MADCSYAPAGRSLDCSPTLVLALPVGPTLRQLADRGLAGHAHEPEVGRSGQLGAASRTNICRFRDFRLHHTDRLGEHPARRADDVVPATGILALKYMIEHRLRDTIHLEGVIRRRPGVVRFCALRP